MTKKQLLRKLILKELKALTETPEGIMFKYRDTQAQAKPEELIAFLKDRIDDNDLAADFLIAAGDTFKPWIETVFAPKVFAGADKPLTREYLEIYTLDEFQKHVQTLSPDSVTAQCVHGVDGMGDIGVEPQNKNYEATEVRDLVQLIVDLSNLMNEAIKTINMNLNYSNSIHF